MDLKQEPSDLYERVFKMEPNVASGQTEENLCTKQEPFKNDHYVLGLGDTDNNCKYETIEYFVNVDEIKQEIVECLVPKIEYQLKDVPEKIECDSLKFLSGTIKKEFDVVDISEIKQVRDSEFIQFKTERDFLTTDCDLPTLKSENIEYFDNFEQPCSSKYVGNVISNKKKPRKKLYSCLVCQTNFPSSKSRSTHIDGHFKKRYAACQFCGRLMKRIEFLQHFFIHVVKNRMKNHIHDKPFKYNLSSKNLKLENIVDVDNKLLKCGTCFKTLKYDIGFKDLNHKPSLQHTVEKPFKCDVCSKFFIDKSTLKKHSLIHSGEKPFKCDICSKCFNNRGNLYQHLIVHSGKKPFKCDICSKCFNLRSTLQKHLIIHSGEKPYKCDICSKCFNDKSTLTKHILIHSGEKPFKCDICSKCFNGKSNLKQHLIIHSGEKPYKCEICSKCFNHKSTLQKHLIIHTGEKPFKCDICSKGFTQKCTLLKHLLIMHSDDKKTKV